MEGNTYPEQDAALQWWRKHHRELIDAVTEFRLTVQSERDALKAAQPQQTEERAENSPASPVQQLKAEIAALLPRLEDAIRYDDHDDIRFVYERMRQLSAVWHNVRRNAFI